MKTCGCVISSTCGCCSGIANSTPLTTENRPGLPELRYRVGTHASFLDSMKARIPSARVNAPGKDGQTIETFQPLMGLTTRTSADPAIALFDAWASAADVLTFYQERIANEGYLRTATERRSVLELARLTGYSLRPGVAATAYLAYTLEDQQPEPVLIPAGSRSQSVPGPDEMPQSFETSDDLTARVEWNSLQVKKSQPQHITIDNVLWTDSIWVAGGQNTLRPGDHLLFVFSEDGDTAVVRSIESANAQFMSERTEIVMKPVPREVAATAQFLMDFVAVARTKVDLSVSGATQRAVRHAVLLRNNTLLGMYSNPAGWVGSMLGEADGDVAPEILQLMALLNQEVEKALEEIGSTKAEPVVTSPDDFTGKLLKRAIPQVRNSEQLARGLTRTFARGSDANSQLLIQFEPKLQDSFYRAWANANVNKAASKLLGLFRLLDPLSLFGSTVSDMATYTNGQLNTPDLWKQWPVASDEDEKSLFLEKAEEKIGAESWVLVQTRRLGEPTSRKLHKVTAAETAQRSAYAINGKSTRVTFSKNWWEGSNENFRVLRSTLVYGQAEPFSLVDGPVGEPVFGQQIELGALYNELKSGRWVIFSGERTDIPGVTGVKVSELLMISGLKHDFDATLPGDKTHTTLELATATAYQYKRDTLSIYANVVKATHGETRSEALGSGNAGEPLQSFTLKQPPLTFVPSPVPSGVESTLHVLVNDVEWNETDTLAGLGSKDRVFVTQTSDEGKTTVIFGDGVNGSRLPTGVENIKAVYRNSIGKGGNVRAEQISMLMSRPQGVKSVLNPLRSSGGADKETRDQARENAPMALHALDRLVSVKDYEDFTRTFAGIAKASSTLLSDGRQQLIHVTIAGADDIPIDPISDLSKNLIAALQRYSAPGLAVRVESRDLVALVLSANIKIVPNYQWEPVVKAVRWSLLETFGFARRSLAQPVLLCEVIAAIQSVEGVLYVDVDAFGGVEEKTSSRNIEKDETERKLISLDEISQAVANASKPAAVNPLTSAGTGPRKQQPASMVDAQLAGVLDGMIFPAQLAIFLPAAPETLILNQIV